jgi:hypothetical protein
MKPVTFTNIQEADFHDLETIRIEIPTNKIINLNSWLLYAYNAICGVLAIVTFYALVNISTVNPERFYWLLLLDIIAFFGGAVLWVGRRL